MKLKNGLFLTILVIGWIYLSACTKSHSPIEDDDNDIVKEWSTPLILGSYNMEVKGNNASYPWEDRKPLVKTLLDKQDFDVIGAQEAFTSQLDELELSAYDYIDYSTPGDQGVSRTPILYKKSRLNVIKSGVFWLSETPDNPNGKSWDAPRPRICNWAIFLDKKSNIRFFMVNVHVWHKPLGIVAQEEGLKFLLSHIQELAEGNPIVITGDFNINQNEANYSLVNNSGLVRDSYHLTNSRVNGSLGTFNGHHFNGNPTLRIDHVFVETKNRVNVQRWEVVSDSFDGNFPSDHFPVKVDLSFPIEKSKQ